LRNDKNKQNKVFVDMGNGSYRFGKAFFKHFKMLLNWTDARSHCQSQGGDLASISTARENDFLFEMFMSKYASPLKGKAK